MPPNPPLSLVPDHSEQDYLQYLNVNDVVDVQTLESEAPFFGVTVAALTTQFMVATPDLRRAAHLYNKYPLLIPWHAVAWIRLGTGEASFTDPADDGPDTDEFGLPLRDDVGNLIDRFGNLLND